MTRIEVYIYPKALSKIGIGLGSCLLLLGLFSFTKAISDDFNTAFLSGDWNSVLNIVQGLLFVGLGVYNFRNKKYYIEWDKEELRFVLPDSKKLEKIKFSEIQSVNIKLFEIKLHLSPNRKRTLDINNLRDEDLKKVKSEFKTLQNLNMNINKTGFNILNALLFISITVGFYELVEIKTLVGVFITPAFIVAASLVINLRKMEPNSLIDEFSKIISCYSLKDKLKGIVPRRQNILLRPKAEA